MPDRLLPEDMVIQVALLEADQEQPAPVATLKLPSLLADDTAIAFGASVMLPGEPS